ncbi:MAG TPA: aminoglycoside adenylyltransferase domain-containing protein [Chloroflexia bacterium]
MPRTLMPGTPQPTPYTEVNAVLHGFATQLRATLGDRFRGMYLTGSLALGDFDPHTSDIDFIVLTDAPLSADLVEAIRDMHERFGSSGSPWAHKIEAVYIPPEALHAKPVSPASYPQVEKDHPLFMAPLESGWIFHVYTLREHGVTVAGPDVRPLIGPVDPDDMRRAAAPIAELWLEQALHDPAWLTWLYERRHQAFVVLTLCRLLYTLDSGSLASKPAAARWAVHALGPRWATLIERSLAGQHGSVATPENDVTGTVTLVRYTVDQFQQWKSSLPVQ